MPLITGLFRCVDSSFSISFGFVEFGRRYRECLWKLREFVDRDDVAGCLGLGWDVECRGAGNNVRSFG